MYNNDSVCTQKEIECNSGDSNIGIDVAAFQIDVDCLMSLAAQNFYRLAADAAGAAGDYINSHKLSVSFPRK